MKNLRNVCKKEIKKINISQAAKKCSDDVDILKSKSVRQEKITESLLIPMFINLFQMFISHMSSVLDNTLYSNVKCNLGRYLTQLQNVQEGKHFLS